MGADLYIQCAMADTYDAEWRDKFERACSERDKAIKKYGDKRVVTVDSAFHPKFESPEVQALQDLVDEYSDKMWAENPYYFRDSYNGSLVSLYEAQIAVGDWNGSYYSPPIRNWSFDTRFSDINNLPPGTPAVGYVVRMSFRPVY